MNNYIRIVCLSGAVLFAADTLAAAPHSAEALRVAQSEDAYYPVRQVALRYIEAFGGFPTVQELGNTEVLLVATDRGFTAPRDGVAGEGVRLYTIASQGEVLLSASAIDAISRAIRARLEDQFNTRFFVAVDPTDIDPTTGEDLRRARRRSLDFVIEYTGPTYQIQGFELNYLYEGFEGQPPIDDLMNVGIDLVKSSDAGFVAWRPGIAPMRMTLNEIASRPTEPYSASGVQQVLVALRDYLVDQNLIAVNVAPLDQSQLQQSIQQPQTISLVITTGVVSEVRTLAVGARIKPGPERVNHPLHARIREFSPVQPTDPNRQLLRRDQIDDYVFFLGRHPGRRVDVAIAPGEPLEVESGVFAPAANLDYLVTENRPWTIYGQASNTGTRNTGRWRQRFGLLHTQLTNNDDVLNIDYQTAGFSDVHTVSGYYDFRLSRSNRVRGRLYGHYGEFDASEVGFEDLRFTGDSWSIGGEVAANLYQRRQLFLDLFAGGRYMNTKVENFFFDFPVTSGEEAFFLPYIGLRLERYTLKANTFASLMFEGQFGDVTNVDRDELDALGRLFPDRDWVVMKWDAQHSFFLEPLINRAAWEDPETPKTSTLAHEIALSFRGQYAFEHRLIPQAMMVAGGFYSVRGYPESIVAGDSALIASAEYRFYLPRVLGIDPDPKSLFGYDTRTGRQPFRWRPQHVYGRADWDLILRGFVDIGHTINTDRLPFETDETLIGAGVGAELQVRRNLNVRVDWGVALREIEDRYRSGRSRVHFVGTLLF